MSAEMRSRDITVIVGEIVQAASRGLTITHTDYRGKKFTEDSPTLSYIFGNSRDVKAFLDEMSRGAYTQQEKLPLVALMTPVVEDRTSKDLFAAANVNILIACKTSRDWDNSQRREYSFAAVLRPIYTRIIKELKADTRLDFGYDQTVRHSYSENYSYGRYGAYDSAGEEVSEPIDAIVLKNLEIRIKKPNCRLK